MNNNFKILFCKFQQNNIFRKDENQCPLRQIGESLRLSQQ